MSQPKHKLSKDLVALEQEFRASIIAVRGARPPRAEGRAQEILKVAHDMMCESDFEKFSVREVASRVGISLASIQYHYATRAKLLNEMIEFRLDQYEDSLLEYVCRLARDPETAFLTTIDWFLDDAWSEETASFSFHFWGLAQRDENASQSLSRYQKVYRDFLGLLVRNLNPATSRIEASARGALLSSLIDGTMPIASAGKQAFPEFARLRDSVKRTALQIATAN